MGCMSEEESGGVCCAGGAVEGACCEDEEGCCGGVDAFESGALDCAAEKQASKDKNKVAVRTPGIPRTSVMGNLII